MNKCSKRHHLIFICLINLVILVTTLFLTPIGDDWGYATVPLINRTFVMSSRPFDSLFGFLLAKIPFAFPALNHIVVVAGHCISSVVFYLIATNILKISDKRSFLFSVVFTVSAACCATVLSIDSLNQSMSLCFGVVGIYAYMRWSNHAVIKAIIYLIFSILATFSKESGIVFFFIIPLFDFQSKGLKVAWKQMLANYILGGIFCLLFVKLVSSSQGIGTINIVNIIKNTVTHLGFSAVQLDTVSFFGYGQMIMPLVTALLSLPLLLLIAKTIVQKLIKKDWLILFLGALTVVSTFPHNLLSGAQEMNSYPTAFFMMLFFAYLCKDWNKKALYCAIVPYLASALICSGIKYTSMYKCSVQSQEILNNIEEQVGHISPRKIKVYAINNFNEDAYGVFVLSPSGTIGYGHGVKSFFGYGCYIDVEYFYNRTDKIAIGSPQATLINVSDEVFIETIQGYAQNELENKTFDLCLIIDRDCNVQVIN